jgi:hypothetical protein
MAIKRLLVAGVAGAALSVASLSPALAMHASPAPVDDMAPSHSGHYDTPDTGSKGEARPWEAGPRWNR